MSGASHRVEEAEGPEFAMVVPLRFPGQVVGACWPSCLTSARLVWHCRHGIWEMLVTAER